MGIFSDFYDGGVVSPLASNLESRLSSLSTLGSFGQKIRIRPNDRLSGHSAKKSEKIPRTLLNIIIRKLKISC
jgi:hypothetical protein